MTPDRLPPLPDEHSALHLRHRLASVYPHYLAKVERKGRTKEEATMQEIRYLDKLVDELAKDRPLSKVLRS